MKPKQPENLGSVLQQYLKAIGAEKRIKEMQVLQTWEKVVGKYIARDASKFEFKDGVFTVKFRSAIIRNEISMRKSMIMDRLNEEVGDDIVKKIEIK